MGEGKSCLALSIRNKTILTFRKIAAAAATASVKNVAEEGSAITSQYLRPGFSCG